MFSETVGLAPARVPTRQTKVPATRGALMRILVAVSLSMLGVAGLRAQVNGLQCNAAAAQTPIARAEGTAEPVSDVILTCSGGTPTPLGQAIPLSNVSIFLNTNITSR